MNAVTSQPRAPSRGPTSNGSKAPCPDPGLFDRPDRALAALRELFAEASFERAPLMRAFAARLEADSGTRFWTEAEMREYTRLVNELLDELGARIIGADGRACRLGVKAHHRPRGRYALFRCRTIVTGRDRCQRVFPERLSLQCGPS